MLDSILPNITDFILLNVKYFILTESRLFPVNVTWHVLVCVSCLCLGCWGASHVHIFPLELWHTSVKWFTYHMHYMSYQMLGTVSACMLHHSIYSFLLCAHSSALLVPSVSYLSLLKPFVYGQNPLCFSSHLVLFSVLSAPLNFGSTLVPAHCIFLVYF